MKTAFTCKVCNREFIFSRRLGHRKTQCGSCTVTLWRRRQKKKAIDYKGGKCERCGYDKCPAALTFHHLDPSKKEFGIAAFGIARRWELVRQELDKCMLVCQNCHAEIHSEEHQ